MDKIALDRVVNNTVSFHTFEFETCYLCQQTLRKRAFFIMPTLILI